MHDRPLDLGFVSTGRLMVEHMHELGHRELVLVSEPEHVVARIEGRLADGARMSCTLFHP